MIKMFFSPVQVKSKDSRLAIDLVGESYPVYFCISLDDPNRDPDEKQIILSTPIVAIVSPYNSNETRLATQMHYTD